MRTTHLYYLLYREYTLSYYLFIRITWRCRFVYFWVLLCLWPTHFNFFTFYYFFTVKIRLPDLGAVYGTYTCLRWRQIHLWTLLPMVSPSSFCAFFNHPMHRTGHEIHPDRAVPGPEDHKNPPRLGKEIQGGQYWQLKHAVIHWNTSILSHLKKWPQKVVTRDGQCLTTPLVGAWVFSPSPK